MSLLLCHSHVMSCALRGERRTLRGRGEGSSVVEYLSSVSKVLGLFPNAPKSMQTPLGTGWDCP